MKDNDRSNGGDGESAWRVAMLSAALVLAAALGTLAGIRASFFFLSQLKGAFSFMGSGVLLLVTLANVTAVLLVAFSWLWSFWPRRVFTKEDANICILDSEDHIVNYSRRIW